jgi:MoaA/NifB/PqqE/SkfB family radical SAM enzyme
MPRPPLVVAWETTRACPLACRHCSATAQRLPHPAELTHEEGLALIHDLALALPGSVLILTGASR